MIAIYFNLFASCLPVKGAKRSIICDVQRNAFDYIPNALFDLLTEHKGESLIQIKETYDHHPMIDEYLTFLIDHEYGFFSETPEEFPAMSPEWKTPSLITNAIIDISDQSNHNFNKITKELDDLGCHAVQIRVYNLINLSEIESALINFQDTIIKQIEVFLPNSQEISKSTLTELCDKFPRLAFILIHGASKDFQFQAGKYQTNISFIQKTIDSEACCGVIDPSYFTINTVNFTESIHFNSCLNKKVSIDHLGQIKNCPSTNTSFGNHRKTSLSAVIKDIHFRKLWKITKDQINVCKDCEYRYICTDCRAYQQKDNLYNKPKKCGYDPYTAQWESITESN